MSDYFKSFIIFIILAIISVIGFGSVFGYGGEDPPPEEDIWCYIYEEEEHCTGLAIELTLTATTSQICGGYIDLDWSNEEILEDWTITYYLYKNSILIETTTNDHTTVSGTLEDIFTVEGSMSPLSNEASATPSDACIFVTVGRTGRQNATTTIPITDQDLGGAFTFQATGSSGAVIDSIRIKQKGSLATSTIDNIRMYYKAEETCSTTTPVDAVLFGVADVFDDNNIATTTATTTEIFTLGVDELNCLYIVYDLIGEYSTSTLGRSIDFEITNPSIDVISSNSTIETINSQNISKRTIITIPGINSLLSLKMKVINKDPTVYYLLDNAVWKMEGGGTPVRLTNPNLKVHSLTFDDLTGANSGGTIRMKITMSNVLQDAVSSFLNVVRTYTTSASVKAWLGSD